jgi:hypothetical protein
MVCRLGTRKTFNKHDSYAMVTGYGMDDRRVGVRVPVGSRIFTSQYGPDRLWSTTSYPMGTGGSSPGVKRRGSEVDHMFR